MTNHVGVILEPSSIISLRVFFNGDFEGVFFPVLKAGNSGVEAKPTKPLFYHAAFTRWFCSCLQC